MCSSDLSMFAPIAELNVTVEPAATLILFVSSVPTPAIVPVTEDVAASAPNVTLFVASRSHWGLWV